MGKQKKIHDIARSLGGVSARRVPHKESLYEVINAKGDVQCLFDLTEQPSTLADLIREQQPNIFDMVMKEGETKRLVLLSLDENAKFGPRGGIIMNLNDVEDGKKLSALTGLPVSIVIGCPGKSISIVDVDDTELPPLAS